MSNKFSKTSLTDYRLLNTFKLNQISPSLSQYIGDEYSLLLLSSNELSSSSPTSIMFDSEISSDDSVRSVDSSEKYELFNFAFAVFSIK